MTPHSRTGWNHPSPLLPVPPAPCGSPSEAAASVVRVHHGQVGWAEGSLSHHQTISLPQEAPWHPQSTRTDLARRIHGETQEETVRVSSSSTHSFTELCNAPFNHQMRSWMQMCPLCNGVSKVLCCLQPLFQAVRLLSPHDEPECQILITKQIISTYHQGVLRLIPV